MNRYQEQAKKAIDRLQSQQEKELIRNYQTALSEIRSKLSAAYEKADWNWAEMNKYNRLAKLEEQIGEEIRKLTGKNAMSLKKGQRHMFEEAYYRTAYALSSEVGADLGFALLDTDEIQRSIENPLDRVGFLQRNRDNQYQLTRQLREQLTQGLVQGESYRTTARRIKERMDIGAGNALRIARTENNRIRNKSSQDSMEKAQESGLILKKTWLSSHGARTRPEHEEMDGVTVDIDQPFDVDGYEMMYPGDESAPGYLVINCRCTTIAEPEGFKANASAVTGKKHGFYDDFKKNLK
ncbi:phage minor head protein [Virgibacillus oceani]